MNHANLPAAGTSAKGELLGDRISQTATANAIESLMSRLMSWFWTVIWNNPNTPPAAERVEEIQAACDEFRDLAVQIVQGLGGVDAAKTLLEDEDFVAAKDFRGLLALTPKGPSGPVKGRGEKPDPNDDEDEDAGVADDGDDENEDAGIRRGDHVKCTKGDYKGMCGKVVSVHKGEMVPDVKDDVIGTQEEPAARVRCYKAIRDGHQPTDHHVGVKCAHLEKVEEFRPPKRTKKEAKIDSLNITIDPSEIVTDAELEARRQAAVKAALTSPEAAQTFARAIADQLCGAI